MDVLAGLTTGIVTLVVVGGGLLVVGLVVLFRRQGDRGIRRSRPSAAVAADGPAGFDDLRLKAGTLLVKLDDAVRSADEEIGYALAQFGPDTAKPYGDAVAAARAKVTEAFRLKQALDDAVPDSDRKQREWTLQIIALCEQADTALTEQASRFAELRSVEVNAGATLDDLRSRIAASTSRIAEARTTLAGLAKTYAPATLAAVKGNPDAAAKLLADATKGADAAAPEISSSGVNHVSTQLQEASQAAHRADLLLEAVDRTARDLAAASQALTDLRERSAADITEAKALTAPDADTGKAVIDAIAGVEKALAAKSKDPVADLDRIGDAVSALDLAMASARNQTERLEHARTAYLGTVVSATNQIATASDFIAAHGGSVEARTRLAEAQRQFVIAQAATDPVEALDTIRRAVTLAQDADALARYDATGAR